MVDMSNNELAGTLPRSMDNLRKIRRFSVSKNKIEGTRDSQECRCSSRQALLALPSPPSLLSLLPSPLASADGSHLLRPPHSDWWSNRKLAPHGWASRRLTVSDGPPQARSRPRSGRFPPSAPLTSPSTGSAARCRCVQQPVLRLPPRVSTVSTVLIALFSLPFVRRTLLERF